MYYTIYMTTNIVNGKIYIGAHQTDNLDDGYLGSGYLFRYAIKKYGRDSFKKEILFLFDSKEEMFKKEVLLVTEQFIKLKTNYNIRVGGKGGFTKEQQLQSSRLGAIATKNKWSSDEKWSEKMREQRSIQFKEQYTNGKRKITTKPHIIGKFKHTEESKNRQKETMFKNGHSKGEKNSQFGKMWIYNSTNKENKLIKKTDEIPEGWFAGRKMK